MLRVGIVGVGGIGVVHALNWDAVPNAELVAVCDVRPERFEKVENKSVATYTDMKTMIEEVKPDIVDICTPSYLHIEHARVALEYGCHVLLEKPVSLKEEDIDGLYALAQQKGVKLMIAHVVRFWYEYVKLRELVLSQEYGRVLNAYFARLSGVPRLSFENWMQCKSKSGLVPFDLHIHDLDFIVHTFGAPKSWQVKRSTQTSSDFMFVQYDYGDFFINCEASWFDGAYPFQCRFRVQFEKAVVEAVGGVVTVYTPDDQVHSFEEVVKGKTGINLPTSNAYANELCYFADCVEQDKPIDMVPKEELKTVLHILESM